MLSIFLLSFRESFEAWLVVGVIATYLKTTNRNNLLKSVYLGAFAGAVFSFIVGVALFLQAASLPENSKNIFQGIMMFLSSGLVAYFIIWMSKQRKFSIIGQIKDKIENNTTALGIFVLSFFSVLREGVELVTFIMSQISGSPIGLILTALIGMLLSGVATIAIFFAASHYLIQHIFRVLGALLIYFGAEMFSEGLLKFFPLNGEIWEDVLALIFALPAMYIFFKDDVERLWNRVFKK